VRFDPDQGHENSPGVAATVGALCTFAVLSGVTLAAGELLETLLVLGAYTGSFSLFIPVVTVAIAVGYEALAERARHHSTLVTRAAGLVLVVGGIGQLYFALAA